VSTLALSFALTLVSTFFVSTFKFFFSEFFEMDFATAFSPFKAVFLLVVVANAVVLARVYFLKLVGVDKVGPLV